MPLNAVMKFLLPHEKKLKDCSLPTIEKFPPKKTTSKKKNDISAVKPLKKSSTLQHVPKKSSVKNSSTNNSSEKPKKLANGHSLHEFPITFADSNSPGKKNHALQQHQNGHIVMTNGTLQPNNNGVSCKNPPKIAEIPKVNGFGVQNGHIFEPRKFTTPTRNDPTNFPIEINANMSLDELEKALRLLADDLQPTVARSTPRETEPISGTLGRVRKNSGYFLVKVC